MNSRNAVIAVLVTFAMVLPAMPFLASEADADTDVFAGYYGKQLNTNQKAIYDAMMALDPSVTVNDGGADGYYIELTVDSLVNENDHLKDATVAWQATKLDAASGNNWAFWTWTLADAKPTVTVTASSATSCTLHIGVASQFFPSGFATAVANVNTAINAIDVTGNNAAEKVKNLNSKLTSSPYVHVSDNSEHVYANTIYAIAAENVESDKVYMTSFAYSVLFKALCAKGDVSCAQVFGFYGNNSTIAAWNDVVIDGKVYGVDTAGNAISESNPWLAAGVYTYGNGELYGKVHNAFVNSSINGFDYSAFTAETLNNDGYAWPVSDDIWEKVNEYLPWILIGIICVILAVVLVIMARKGEY